MLIPRNTLANNSLDLGVIGAGRITRMAHLSLLDNIPSVSIKFIADIDIEKATALTKLYGGTAIEVDDPSALPECDALLLAVPVGVRKEYIREFGRRSTPIFTEKPFAVNIDEHTTYLDNTDQILCNYMRTNFSSTRQLKSIVKSEMFGSLKKVKAAGGGIIGTTGHSENSYRMDASLSGGGILMETGCHLLSQIVFIFDSWNLSVIDSDITMADNLDIDVDSTIAATSRDNTIEIEFRLSEIAPVENEVRLIFEHADISIDPRSADALVHVQSSAVGKQVAKTFTHSDQWGTTLPQAVYIRWMQFLNMCWGKPVSNPHETVETAPEVTRLITQMYDRS